ncbi:MAG: NADH-quinone oxidoreductase subunit M [Candidatus Schekmanbacteria bacterium RIFCSPHIGHO2_02_FULL_38_11]|uniref:NADH-quinone oxidoreductase subunit M n=1 Tax=Candidatus Schekmanbacteria bacterium RIFCSPLOWO2_12_FULL_38_15 TaxID=1817883 RepID=A0A1F7SFH2_9BACT|nr:MAG: NADH-quinone oxidoreductase subunit M [Candidatus Schekmanbacteria bacterium RIFCSPLOWO2_12_FULL_38_15]OGL54382.1 MAG: NADH-quinone oxidoreductase subunit M [Candidatus Schekmanbacteria bacterium RIFCSPHIGHO2_02_FULL_38_11]
MFMSKEFFPVLTVITFFPLIGVFFILMANRNNLNTIRWFALLTSVINFFFSLHIYNYFDSTTSNMQFEEFSVWIREWGVNYHVGIDGISLLLVLLTTFITPLAILSSWKAVQEKVKEYMIVLLFLETGMIGVFVSLDLFLFYVFWEVMLIPMYLLIGIWGGKRRIYAAIKFVLYTMAGSVLMLVGILVLYFINYSQKGEYSFDLLKFYELNLPFSIQIWLFLAFGIAFAIKVPMFPFHTWLPDAHVEAPTAGSVILAGVLLKMGTYGFLRFCLPLFPQASYEFIPLISILAIIGIIYGALVSMVQKDIKKLVAYSSVSHLGFVMLGLFTINLQGIEGGLLQMINHGLSTGALFLIVGMIYERRHTRMIEDFGGLSKQMPIFATFFMIVTLSSIGLPGLNGFVGEFLILLGTFQENRTYAFLAATGIIFTAVYMLWMFQRVMFGEIKNPENKNLKDLSLREIIVLVPIVILIIVIGVYPAPFLNKTEVTIKDLISRIKGQYQVVEKKNMPVELDNRVGKNLFDKRGFLTSSLQDKNVLPIGFARKANLFNNTQAKACGYQQNSSISKEGS